MSETTAWILLIIQLLTLAQSWLHHVWEKRELRKANGALRAMRGEDEPGRP